MRPEVNECPACGTELGEPTRVGWLPLPRGLLEPVAGPARRWDVRVAGCGGCGSVAIVGGPTPEEVVASVDRPTSRTAASVARAAREATSVLANIPVARGDTVLGLGAGDGLVLRPFQQVGCEVVNVEPAAARRAVGEAAGIAGISRPFGAGAAGQLDALSIRTSLVLGRTVLGHAVDPDAVFGELSQVLVRDGRAVFTLPDADAGLALSPIGLLNPEWRWLWTPHALSLMALRHGMVVEHVDGTAAPGSWSCTVAWARQDGPFPLARPYTNVLASVAGLEHRVASWRRTIERHVERTIESGRWIVAVGAGATGVTALNLAELDADRVEAIIDVNPLKQGLRAPGVDLPITGVDMVHPGDPAELLALVPELVPELRTQHAELITGGMRLHTIAS